jgi:hypothetical protein
MLPLLLLPGAPELEERGRGGGAHILWVALHTHTHAHMAWWCCYERVVHVHGSAPQTCARALSGAPPPHTTTTTTTHKCTPPPPKKRYRPAVGTP